MPPDPWSATQNSARKPRNNIKIISGLKKGWKNGARKWDRSACPAGKNRFFTSKSTKKARLLFLQSIWKLNRDLKKFYTKTVYATPCKPETPSGDWLNGQIINPSVGNTIHQLIIDWVMPSGSNGIPQLSTDQKYRRNKKKKTRPGTICTPSGIFRVSPSSRII